jgi:hypothetical protein
MNRYHFAYVFMVAFALTACGPAQESHSTIIQKQVGRYAVVGASGGYPPLVVDTAGGCVMAIALDQTGKVTVDEVEFPDGTNSCNASKQLLVVDTLSKIRDGK